MVITDLKAAAQRAADECRAVLISDASWQLRDAAIAAEREAAHAAETGEERAKRLRAEARDLRASYERNMAEYGREIGRAQTIADLTIAKLVESAAKGALSLAGDQLTAALAAEAEADRIEANGFVILFDGVSVKREAA